MLLGVVLYLSYGLALAALLPLAVLICTRRWRPFVVAALGAGGGRSGTAYGRSAASAGP